MQRWQERRSPGAGRLPRRRTDRVEDGVAWVLNAAGLFVLVLSVLAGVHTEAAVAEQGRTAEHERVRVEAVVLRPAADPDQEADADSPSWASVQYVDGAGRMHETDIALPERSPAGTLVPVWVDRAGRVVPAPFGAVDAAVLGALVGLGTAATGGFLLVMTWALVRRALHARNAAAWAREWAAVEPEWSGRRQ